MPMDHTGQSSKITPVVHFYLRGDQQRSNCVWWLLNGGNFIPKPSQSLMAGEVRDLRGDSTKVA